MRAIPLFSRYLPVCWLAVTIGVLPVMDAGAQSNVYPPVSTPASERQAVGGGGASVEPVFEGASADIGVVAVPVGGAVPVAAQREIVRRQQLAGDARDAMVRAEEFRAEGNLEWAVSDYRRALDTIPDSPMTKELRNQIVERYASASHDLARQKIEEGRYDEAIGLLEAVLAPNVAPNHTFSKRLLEKLKDPTFFNPALSPRHVQRVQQVEDALAKAMAYYDLGDFDGAEKEYFRVLNIDRYNTGARRGLEINERAKTEYADAAYDHTRARYVREVMEQWESRVPDIGLGPEAAGGPRLVQGPEDGAALNRLKLKRIVIPLLEFQDTPIEDAIEFLRQKSIQLDVAETDPSRKGVNIIIQDGDGAAGPSPRITLKLSNVPLVEALRYTTELASRKVKVEAFAVKIVPLSEIGDELFTKTYRVPPNFLTLGAGDAGGGGAGAAPVDPFAAPAEAPTASALRPKRTATEVLQDAGITFPPGSSAFFNPATSQLVVRNTQSNMQLIDTFVDSIGDEVQKQIVIGTKFVEIQQNDLEEFGFDWLLGPFSIGNDGVFGSGGTIGSTRAAPSVAGAVGDFPIIPPSSRPGIATPLGNVTSALRSGQAALNSNSIDSVIANSAVGSAVTTAMTPVLGPAVFGITGVLTDPQFAMVIRAISQHKGADILTAPSVTARSGQRAKIEVIREFIYPTEYDPPELPNTVGSTSGAGVFPVTPANPTAFEVRSTGVTLEADPVIGPDGFTIDLNLAPEVVEFDGFINYGSPITSGGVPITANRIVMPVFSTRKVATAVTVWDGQTVVIGGLIREDVQNVEDKIPILGDAPIVGRLFRSKVDQRMKRNLTMFVTAKLIDPAGQPIRKFEAHDAGAADTVAGGPALPTP